MKNIIKAVLFIFIIFLIVYIFNLVITGYRINYFNDFTRAELNLKESSFRRDIEEKYDDKLSYRIDSPTYNDAMFYKTLEVKKNTAYKITCKVKTRNVETKEKPSDSGAHISIMSTTEKSKSIQGTTDWQEITLYFNSKNRESIDIAFRLGGIQENCRGTAWFADFKLEQGAEIVDNVWNYACFIFKNTNINLDRNVNISMTENDIYNIKENILRFKKDIQDFSNSNIIPNCDIIEINEPISTISYDEDNGYYISGDNISELINKYIENSKYHYIFAIAKFGDSNIEIPVNDWLGLGSMTYQGIGFSNIRVSSDMNSTVYKYSRYNQFPEEVFVHEFIHDLERISMEAELETPQLHNYELYGYKVDRQFGMRDWYIDYMKNSIKYDGKLIGISPVVYRMKPATQNDFIFSIPLNFIKEPENILEEIHMILMKTLEIVSMKLEDFNSEGQGI